ncbi:MAG: class I SAM-dependent methyltransferase [Anaerolineae bacterium]
MTDDVAGRTGSLYEEIAQTGWEDVTDSVLEQVKLEVHLHYLREYLKREDRALEVGAGRGRFTAELAAISQRIVVADISPLKLQINQRNAHAMGYAHAIESWLESDMRDMRRTFQDGEFDAVVCYGGPLSYVFDQRERAMKELVRVTRPGGILFLSAKSLWGTIHQHLPAVMGEDPRMNREIVQSGDFGPDKVAVATQFMHAYRADEFQADVENAGAEVLVLSASDALSATWQELLQSWRSDERIWRHLLDLEIEACRTPGCQGMGSHIIAIAKKKG